MTAGEARRTTLARFEDDPILAPHAALFAKHFAPDAGRADAGARSFEVQTVTLTAGREAVLAETAEHEHPMVVVFDHGKVAWSKERPTGGIVSPALHLALAPHPLGGAVLFFYDPPTRIVGARVWADDGDPFAELEVLHEDTCDALSAAYWPSKGWVVVAARPGGARAERLGENGRTAWGPAGIEVGDHAGAGAGSVRVGQPVSIVVQGAAVTFVELAARQDVPSRVLALRYDADGKSLGEALESSPIPRVTFAGERVVATPAAGGAIDLEVRSVGFKGTLGP
jgi:hypothetical protein